MKSKKGFTLVELLAVMIIISALSIIIIPSIINYINRNKKDISDAAKKIIYAGAELYLDNNANLFPKNEGYSNCIKLKDISDAGYLETPLLDVQSGRSIDLETNYVKASYIYDQDLGIATYKYSISDSCEATIADGYELNNGSNVVLNNKKVVGYKIYGNGEQDSYTGKNLINVADFNTTFENKYYANYFVNNPLFQLEENTTYTLSFDYVFNNLSEKPYTKVGYGTYGYNADLPGVTMFTNLTSGRQTATVTTPSSFNNKYTPNLAIRFARFDHQTSLNVDISNVQFELGSEATSYEPYVGGIPSPNPGSMQKIRTVGDLITDTNDSNYGKYKIPIKVTDASNESTTYNIYLDEPLRKVGDYADYIDFTNKKLVRKVAVGTITSTSNLGKIDSVTDYSVFYIQNNSLLNYYEGMPINTSLMSPTFKYHAAGEANTNGNWSNNYQISSVITSTDKRIVFTLPNSITDVNSAKEWLQSNQVEYYYPVSNQTEQTIELPDMPSSSGETTYTIDTETKPSNVEWLVMNK